MKKIIFLDFDGVLNNWRYDNPWLGNCTLKEGYTDRDEYGFLFDKGCVTRLKALIDATDAHIVVSSTWRHLGLEKLNKLWQKRQLPSTILDIIPLNDKQSTGDSTSLSRGECIDLWLKNNPVGHYLILDDTDDFLSHQRPFWVNTDGDVGFSENDLTKSITILNT